MAGNDPNMRRSVDFAKMPEAETMIETGYFNGENVRLGIPQSAY